VTKFVGKFRKNQDYNDDYTYAKNFLHSKKRQSEHPEVKKYIKNTEDVFEEELEISPDDKN
jgi:isochorismate synthase EntC